MPVSLDRIIESIKKEYGVDTTGKIPIGVDTTVFYPQEVDRESDRLRVISVGSLQARKRPLFFVETAKHFPHVDFVWIGGGALKDEVLAKAESENIDNFRLFSPMPHKELAVEMNRSDIFYFPSLHEGLPKVIVEAMACGLPAIAFDAYKPEHVQNGVSGFVVNSDEMAIEKLSLLINNTDTRTAFSKAAIERADAFSWKRVAQMWKDFLIKESGR